MVKKITILISMLLMFPNISLAQDDAQKAPQSNTTSTPGSTAISAGAPAAGDTASRVAFQSGGYGTATKVVVAGLVAGGLAAVVLEAATDGSKDDDFNTPTTTTTTTTTTTSSGN